MGDFGTTQEIDMPLHLQLSMRRAELAANDMTWDQLHQALLNLYHQRLVETQAIKDMLQTENIELEFDMPTDMELAQLALSMLNQEDFESDDDEEMPMFG
tara:strand:- start:48 stop:347 length:300 start_codon:yes stop_codon:yes gene_type:complete